MDIEFHQLALRHADLRIREADRRRRLYASLAEFGQQMPVVAVPAGDGFVLIDAYLRVEVLRRLGVSFLTIMTHVSFSQKIPDLIAGPEEAWEFFGGVPARVVLDNLKAAVTKADRYDPVFSRTFAEYGAWRGFVVDAALPRHPTGKPHVERNVQYVRGSSFRGESFLDRAHVQREAVRWCRETAGQRVHGTTQQRPLVVFENEEKPTSQTGEWDEMQVDGLKQKMSK